MKRQKEPTLAEAAAQLDRRRQAQISRQIEIIDRLLTGDGYDEILRSQTDEIAKLRVENEDLVAAVRILTAENERLRGKVERVEAQHRRYGSVTQNGFCQHCGQPWPCDTRTALADPEESGS